MPSVNPSLATPEGGTVAAGRGWRTMPVLRVFAAWGLSLSLRVIAGVGIVLGMAWVVLNAQPWASDPVAPATTPTTANSKAVQTAQTSTTRATSPRAQVHPAFRL